MALRNSTKLSLRNAAFIKVIYMCLKALLQSFFFFFNHKALPRNTGPLQLRAANKIFEPALNSKKGIKHLWSSLHIQR